MNKSWLIVAVIAGAAQIVVGNAETGTQVVCSLKVKDDFSRFYPLIFDKTGELLEGHGIPDESDTWEVTIRNNEEAILSCMPNYLKNFLNKQFVTVKCVDGVLTGPSGALKWLETGCELRPIEEILSEDLECTEHTFVKYGYTNPVSKKSIILGEACYDEVEGTTNFVHSRYIPKGLKLETNALAVEDERYLKQRHPQGRYKIDLMKAWRAHLEKDGENAVALKQKYTLDDNIQFLSIKKLPWNYAFVKPHFEAFIDLQEEIRNIANSRNVIADYYTGSTSKLKGDKVGESLPRFAVPKYFFIKVEFGHQLDVFVIANNPNLTDNESESFQHSCANQLKNVYWLSEEFKTKYESVVIRCPSLNFLFN